MTRAEHLVFCKKCLNRQPNLQQGLLCSLTGAKANFDSECIEFKLDETVKETILDDKIGINSNEIIYKLSPEIVDNLRLEQNLIGGIIPGVVVGIVGAILWGLITVATKMQIGYMAVAIGAGVGFTIRMFGKGIDNIFGFWGAGISLLSVLLGNYLSMVGFIANEAKLGYIETLMRIDFTYIPAIMKETFRPIDLLFYGLALYEGYRFSFRTISHDTLQQLKVGV